MGVEQYLFFVVVFLAAGLSNEGRFGLHTYMLGLSHPSLVVSRALSLRFEGRVERQGGFEAAHRHGGDGQKYPALLGADRGAD